MTTTTENRALVSSDMAFAMQAVESKKFANIRTPAQAMLLIQYGRELGMSPATSLQAVYEVGGVPTLKANTIACRIKTLPWRGTKKNKYKYKVLANTAESCRLEFYERDDAGVMEKQGEVEYTMVDAKKAGGGSLKSQYTKFPRQMLFARAITEGARIYCPDCLGGIVPYAPEDFNVEVDAEGTPFEPAHAATDEVIDADYTSTEGLPDEELAQLKMDAEDKGLSLPDILRQLGGNPNDVRGMTYDQYTAVQRFIAAV